MSRESAHAAALLTPEPGAAFCGGGLLLQTGGAWTSVQVSTQRMEPLAVWLHAISRPVSGGCWQAGCAGAAKQALTSLRQELRMRAFAQNFFKWEKCHPDFSHPAR